MAAFYLTEVLAEIDRGAGFLDTLSLTDVKAVRSAATGMVVPRGDTIFHQGDPNRGIYLIEQGRVRTYYSSPMGREITLAYWTPGHFVGGPEVFGRGAHMWSGVAVERCRLSYLPGPAVRHLATTIPAFAICLIEGLIAKGNCYSALVQMLGTRSVKERLAQLLLILAERDGTGDVGRPLRISRRITHEQLASIVGSTRQWVTSTLARFQKAGAIAIERDGITILRPDCLTADV